MALIGGTSGNDDLTGTQSNDVISAFEGDDILHGLAGNDILQGGPGADTMYGGLGDDVYFVDHLFDVVTENAGEGVDEIRSSMGIILDTRGANVENLLLTGSANIYGYGNALNNILTGNAGDNDLNGGLGADQMTGGLGNDTYTVDNAGDVVTENAGEGIDEVVSYITYTLGAALENLTLRGFGVDGTGNALDNILDSYDGAHVFKGLGGNDIYIVNSASDTVIESAGEGLDQVNSSASFTLGTNVENLLMTGLANVNGVGNELDNILTGNGAHNVLDGGLGADQMAGGYGNDTYVVDNAGDVVIDLINGGTDTVRTIFTTTLGDYSENLTLTGSANINGTGNALGNILTGNAGANMLTGLGGNDALDGGLGADKMLGGAGDDTYFVDVTGDVVTELAGEGVDTVNSLVSYVLGANIENLTLLGVANNKATGNALNNFLTGNAGANAIDGKAGADTMLGGLGNDTYTVDSAGDVVTEGASAGTDTVKSGVSFTLGDNVEKLTLTGSGTIDGTGNALANTLTGNAGANVLTGLGGNDVIDGKAGADTMMGGLGNDTYTVDDGGDVVTELGGEGTDTVKSSVSYSLAGNVEKLTLTGVANIDGVGNTLVNTLTGNDAINILDGGGGKDTLNGKAGADTLIGGASADTLTGGVGDDIFKYLAATEGGDAIKDFSQGGAFGNDVIDVAAIDSGDGGAGDFSWGGLTPTANGIWYVEVGGTKTVLNFDTDGATGSIEMVLTLTGVAIGLSATDFVL